jgi:hypothetical protein
MKKSFLRMLIIAVIIIFCAVACSKDNVQTLSGSQNSTTPNCDTVNSKYAADVVPILQANCYTCHGNGNTGGSGGINLDGYANLVLWVNNNGKDYLIGNITHAPGFVAMPYGLPKLDDCSINKIISWVNNGAQNN